MSITPYVPSAWISDLPTGLWSGGAGLPVLPFLPGQSPSLTKTPTWSSKVKRAGSGRERRTALWPYPLWSFELSYEVIRHRPTADELAALWEFFNVAQGQYRPWLFVDPSDNQVAGQPFATGDGATTTFQLTRAIRSWSEPVYGVYAPSVEIAGIPTTAFTIIPNGAIAFTTAPASGAALTWSGYFYYGCRFSQDTAGFEQIVAQLWSGKSVKFVSVRP
jgi:uncharacterized protein (TIGR02217 family)